MKCQNPYCNNVAMKKLTVRIPDGSSVFEMNFCEECAKEIWKGLEHSNAVIRGKARSNSLTPERRKEIARNAGIASGRKRKENKKRE